MSHSEGEQCGGVHYVWKLLLFVCSVLRCEVFPGEGQGRKEEEGLNFGALIEGETIKPGLYNIYFSLCCAV